MHTIFLTNTAFQRKINPKGSSCAEKYNVIFIFNLLVLKKHIL